MGVGPSAAVVPTTSTKSHQQRERSFSTAAFRKRTGSYQMPSARRPSCPDTMMTRFDLKKMMEEYDQNRNVSARKESVKLSDEEDHMVEEIRQQFTPADSNGTQSSTSRQSPPHLRERLALRSTNSDASDVSDDSGFATHQNMSSIEELHLSRCPPLREESREYRNSEDTATPVMSPLTEPHTIDIAQALNRPIKVPKKLLYKRRKGRGYVRDEDLDISAAQERPRSKSLGSAAFFGEKPSFGSSLLNREWELVTVSEMCRRLSLDEIERMELPVPEGADTSQILDELMIRQIMEILPPRAEGYPWVSIYNSEKHGFSLSTLYRKMIEFDEDLSPVLLIIRDTNEHVFGAVVSGAIRPSDHYNGTGDSCLLWRFTGVAPHTRELRQYNWTGNNQFFVSAAKDYLSIGAGGGHFGIWLDADLNHGRSQRCDTFDNEPLSGDKEDFIVQFIEAYGFRM